MKILLAKYQISIYVTIKTQVASHGIFVENFERNHKTHTHKHKHTSCSLLAIFLSFLQEISLAARKTLNVQLPYHSLRTVDSVKCLTLPTSILWKRLEMENDSPSKQSHIQSPVKHER